VEGTSRKERWTGQWSCRWLPEKDTYYITCSGSLADEGHATQHAVVLSGYDASRGRFVDRVYAPGGFRDPVPSRRSGVESAFRGDQQPPTPVRVDRKGPNEFVWQSSTVDGAPLTIVFRRAEKPRG
jgi:hypothetical protein